MTEWNNASMTLDEKRAQLQTLCSLPGVMTGKELAKSLEDQGQLLLFDSANRPRVFGDRKGRPKGSNDIGQEKANAYRNDRPG